MSMLVHTAEIIRFNNNRQTVIVIDSKSDYWEFDYFDIQNFITVDNTVTLECSGVIMDHQFNWDITYKEDQT